MTSRLLAERNNKPQETATVPVLVAKARVPGWQQIKDPEKYFEVREVREVDAPRRALRALEQVKDQRLNKTIGEDKPVTEDDLLSKEQITVEHMLKPGQRAVAIKVNAESSIAGFVVPGTHVDVAVTMRGNKSEARIFLQDMLVLAVDAVHHRNPETASMLGQTVTLAATPDEATKLALAASLGELRLLLRSAGDKAVVRRSVTRLEDLDRQAVKDERSDPEEAEGSGRKAPPPPVVPLKPVEDPKATAKKEPDPPAKPAEKPRKRFIMTLHLGGNTERVPFLSGDDDENLPAKPESKPGPRPAPKAAPAPPPPKPAPAPETKPADPTPPTAGAGSRTKRSR
jgi:pilus assembly protein CpaB